MAGVLSKYSFVNAKLRARISKILPDSTFSQLAKAPSLEAALALLLLHQLHQMLDIGDSALSLGSSTEVKKNAFAFQQIVHHDQQPGFVPLTVIAMESFPHLIETLFVAADLKRAGAAQTKPVKA